MVTNNHTACEDQAAPLPTVGLPDDGIRRLTPLFQQGVRVRVAAGISVRDFLVNQLGVDPEYVRGRITTVFLDSSVVDNMEAAWLQEGSCLALSAAMPGLVGATMRKGGYYAAMRGAITLAAERGAASAAGQRVQVTVKLFNLLIEELGPVLLAYGVALPPVEAADLLGEQSSRLSAGSPDVWMRVVTR